MATMGNDWRSWTDSSCYGCPCWSPDGTLVANTAEDNTVQVRAAISDRLVHTLKGHTAPIKSIAWSQGNLIASYGKDKTMRLWDASSGKQIQSFDTDADCIRLAWSPDGKSLAGNLWVSNVLIWDIATKKQHVRCAGYLLGWSADSKAVMAWEDNGRVRWWDRETGKMLRYVDFPLFAFSQLRPNSPFVAVPKGGALHIGDLSNGQFHLTLVPLRDGQWLALRPDGHYRGSPGVEKEIVYVVQTDAGQELLAPDEFAKKYGWKNDPERVRLPRK